MRTFQQAGCRPAALALALALALSAAAFADEVRVRDATGAEIVLAAPAQRVAALGNATALVTVVDGGIDRLVGVGSPEVFNHMLGSIFPEGRTLPDLGGMARTTPNAETLASAHPDVVIMWTGGGAAAHDAAPLLSAGLTVARYRSGSETEMTSAIRMIGELTGRPERGELIAGWRERAETRLATLTGSIPVGERVRALGLFPYGGGLSVYGGGADDPYGNYFYRAGGVNVAEDGHDLMIADVEQIAVWDPDLIVIWATPDSDVTRAVVLDDPIMGATRAARHGRVYVIPAGIGTWGVSGAEDSFYWQWLAELMYPDIIAPTLRSELREGYRMFFDYQLSDAQIDTMLRLDVNAESAGYGRFAAQ